MARTGAFIISGAGSGIGSAIVQRIVKEGHQVFGLGRDPKKLEHFARQLSSPQFSYASVDLSRADETSRAVEAIRRWLSQNQLPLLGLINNAAICDRLNFAETSDVIWQRHFENNIMSAVRLTRDFFTELKSSQPSSVLNISSSLGIRPIAGLTAYSALKAAMINWTQSLALEWAKEKIRVNAIAPGIVDTPIHSFHQELEDSESKQKAHASQPLGRMGRPEDIANAAWFLIGEESSWTTGTVLTVDGGIHL